MRVQSRTPPPRALLLAVWILLGSTAGPASAQQSITVAGFKWNIADTWLLTANVRRPLTVVGHNAGWVPTITCDYSFGR